jgi:hypothetical protein
MTKNPPTTIPLEEFYSNPAGILERVIREHEAVIVETAHGEQAVIKPVSRKSARRKITEADMEAFRSSAGGWADVEIDKFLADNDESRSISTRTPVEL